VIDGRFGAVMNLYDGVPYGLFDLQFGAALPHVQLFPGYLFVFWGEAV